LHELIILLAHTLKLKVSGEGVETAEHWECLRELGATWAKGSSSPNRFEPEAAGNS